MSDQACHFLRLPIELRLIIYEHVVAAQGEAVLWHPLTCVSEQISNEVMPILLRRGSGFFWTNTACEEYWSLAVQPFKKIWRFRLTNAVEEITAAILVLHTAITYHLLAGRLIKTPFFMYHLKLKHAGPHEFTGNNSFSLERSDQVDGVERFMSCTRYYKHRSLHGQTANWVERGQAGAFEMNKKLAEEACNKQCYGGGRWKPESMCMLVFQKQSDQQS